MRRPCKGKSDLTNTSQQIPLLPLIRFSHVVQRPSQYPASAAYMLEQHVRPIETADVAILDVSCTVSAVGELNMVRQLSNSLFLPGQCDAQYLQVIRQPESVQSRYWNFGAMLFDPGIRCYLRPHLLVCRAWAMLLSNFVRHGAAQDHLKPAAVLQTYADKDTYIELALHPSIHFLNLRC